MSTRLLRLRYAGTCARCARSLRAGCTARYAAADKSITCEDCIARESSMNGVAPDAGTAGASARREYERRTARREARIRTSHPRLGGVILALADEPQSTRAFAAGGRGESRLGRLFDEIAATGEVVVLHDPRVLRPPGQIDHIVVGPAAVYVVDAKNYSGQVIVRSTGLLGLGAKHLYVGRRDCSKLAVAMSKQTRAVHAALAGLDEAVGVPIVPVLAFVDAEWPLLFAPDVFADVRVEGESVTRLVHQPGQIAAADRLVIAHRPAQRLPRAVKAHRV